MLANLLLGLAYGFAAGISPGPTVGLTITETLRGGWRAGALVALAPLFTDLPIILLAVFVLRLLPEGAVGWLAIIGAIYIAYLAYETLRGVPTAGETEALPPVATSRSDLLSVLRRGILTNALNPHPYIFWGTVGAPIVVTSLNEIGIGGLIGFLLGFYLLLVGIKMLVAALVHRGRNLIGGRGYRRLIFASGVLLLALAVYLAYDGISMLL